MRQPPPLRVTASRSAGGKLARCESPSGLARDPRRPENTMTSRVPALLIHGGAGADPAFGREELRRGIRDAVSAGWAVLRDGGGAVDAVEAAVCAMEDSPRFNAGRGSVLTSEGAVEMDASIMEGDSLNNGAVACVTNMRHPISLARRILDNERYSLFVGAGAMAR